jgi:hypothetical protein
MNLKGAQQAEGKARGKITWGKTKKCQSALTDWHYHNVEAFLWRMARPD